MADEVERTPSRVGRVAVSAIDWRQTADSCSKIISPGQRHSFHKHPDQEEVIYVLVGEVEQWLDRDKRTLRAGDSVFVPAGMARASFNVGERDATILAIFGPSAGEGGVEAVEVAGEAPWD